MHTGKVRKHFRWEKLRSFLYVAFFMNLSVHVITSRKQLFNQGRGSMNNVEIFIATLKKKKEIRTMCRTKFVDRLGCAFLQEGRVYRDQLHILNDAKNILQNVGAMSAGCGQPWLAEQYYLSVQDRVMKNNVSSRKREGKLRWADNNLNKFSQDSMLILPRFCMEEEQRGKYPSHNREKQLWGKLMRMWKC